MAVVDYLGELITASGKDLVHRPGLTNNDYTTYTRYRDEPGEVNQWLDFETGQPPADPLKWQYIEPNGGIVENCSQV